MAKNSQRHWLREMFERASIIKKIEEVPPLYIVKVKQSKIPTLDDWMDSQKRKLVHLIT